jgi:hypothetical protein
VSVCIARVRTHTRTSRVEASNGWYRDVAYGTSSATTPFFLRRPAAACRSTSCQPEPDRAVSGAGVGLKRGGGRAGPHRVAIGGEEIEVGHGLPIGIIKAAAVGGTPRAAHAQGRAVFAGEGAMVVAVEQHQPQLVVRTGRASEPRVRQQAPCGPWW